MAKPWAKYEHNFINHPKFLALNSNAICLWIEAKNYCDMHHTDGFIPSNALKSFRWRGQKSLRLLTTSIGQREDGSAWAPLWETHLIGFKMHDYLSYNDCRDAVLERMDDANDKADLRKLKNTERMREAREARRAAIDARVRAQVCAVRAHTERARAQVSSGPTATATEVDKKEQEREKSAPSAPSLSPPADPFVDDGITRRAGAFVSRYEALYPQHRHGARYAVRPVRDYAAAVTLCRTWTDDGRLDKLAIVFLTSDHKFAAEGSRTLPQFLALASWCDGRLAEYEAKNGALA